MNAIAFGGGKGGGEEGNAGDAFRARTFPFFLECGGL